MAARPRSNTPAKAQARQLVDRKTQVNNTRDLLNQYKDQMALALPRHLTADRMLRLAMNCVANEPKLLECTKSSMVGSVMQLAQLGLEPGVLGHAYILPYRNNKLNCMEAQIIIGYKGLLQLARNSGQISTVTAHVVYEPDVFEYSFGLTDKLHHVPTDEAVTPAMLTHAYAVVKLKDGGIQWEVMNRREIEEVKASSKAAKSGPWVTHEAEMWKKSVLRRICKLLPSSTELATAIALDEAAEIGIPQTFDVIDIGTIDAQEQQSNEDQSGAGESGDANGEGQQEVF